MVVRHTARRVRAFVQRYERYLAPAALLIGFVIDSFVFTRVDILWNNLILVGHLCIAAAGITLFHFSEEHGFKNRLVQTIAAASPLAVQYSFGALFSGLIIFYSRSASFALSWVFVIVLVLLLLFSETFSHNYRRLRYQIALLFFLLLTFNAFFIPVVVGIIGHAIFFSSAALSLLLIGLFILLLKRLIPKRLAEARRILSRIIVGVTIVFLALYWFGAIPPLPLSLEDGRIAHAVTRVGGEYRLREEPKLWYIFYDRYNTTFHRTPGEAVYVYTSVFAPTKISFTLKHEWQQLNETTHKWVTTNTVAFPVSGGRDGGYRGYTIKSNVTPGKWRVNVRTSYGVTIGRVDFTVVPVAAAPLLIESTY